MIITPAIILSSNELSNNNCPINVAAAPNKINTIENPTVNKTIGVIFIFLLSVNSLSELPDT